QLKYLLLFISPLETNVFLDFFSKQCSQRAKVFNKLSVKTSKTMKLLIFPTVVGLGHSWTACTFSSSTRLPYALITSPRNTSLSVQNVHFFILTNNFYFLSISKTDFKCITYKQLLFPKYI
ncbi:hypothetical protein PanWU01x14_094780, partial [Parasponia andersonii]